MSHIKFSVFEAWSIWREFGNFTCTVVALECSIQFHTLCNLICYVASYPLSFQRKKCFTQVLKSWVVVMFCKFACHILFLFCKGNFPSDVSSNRNSNPASLSLVNALSACCLSTWLPSCHREWSTVELVKTLAGKTKSKKRDRARDRCISADLQGRSISNTGILAWINTSLLTSCTGSCKRPGLKYSVHS